MFGPYTGPNPSYKRMMVFIDGENLVFRFQEMDKINTRLSGLFFEKDIFVWHPNTIKSTDQLEILRATYYTYAVGDDLRINELNTNIKELTFQKDGRSALPNFLKPVVFKKNIKGIKNKGVDIKMAVDILSNVYNNNLDVVYLVSGDGDYLPVIKEILRHGKQVYLAAFSNGLNKKLLNYVDNYYCLDNVYFNHKIEP